MGYPNESEKEFEELCDFVREIKFDRIGTFTYSVEDNTHSFNLADPVPEEVKIERQNTLMEIQKGISNANNAEMKGKVLKVLIEAQEGDFYVGRSYRDAPEVDGEILIPKQNDVLKLGKFYDTIVYDYNEYDLFAQLKI